MHIIEPCCSHRQLETLRKDISNGGTAEFQGYGDLSLTELLPALLTAYNETELLIAAPSLPDQAAEVITTWMRWQWARVDGRGKINVLTHLTLIADLSPAKSPVISEWLKENPFGERLTLVDRQQEDTAIVLPDFAITGPVNMKYGHSFTATATTDHERIRELWDTFLALDKKPNGKAEVTEEPEKEGAAQEKPEEDKPEAVGPTEPEEPAAPAKKHKLRQ